MGLLKFVQRLVRHSGRLAEKFSGLSDAPVGFLKSSAACPTLRPVGRKLQRGFLYFGRIMNFL